MALHNLRIIVIEGGRSESFKNSTASNSDGKGKYKDNPLYKMLNAKQTIKNKVQTGMSPTSVFAMDLGLRLSSQVVKQTANYFISDIGRKNGDSNHQSIINRQIELVSDTMSFGGTIISGAATGSMFGPIGAGIGAVLGAISSAVSLGFKYAERDREYQHTMFKERNDQAYRLSRANFSVHTGRMR